jgi:dipeptidyl aminopeptidase/acylaminoacyl peptidase
LVGLAELRQKKGTMKLRTTCRVASSIAAVLFCAGASLAQAKKPAITIDEYFNNTDFSDVRLSPDGTEAVIATVAPDWQHDRFREDLWLWSRTTGTTNPLTQSGHDKDPQWSPDGKYVAFQSDRRLAGGETAEDKQSEEPSRVWIISITGGEAFPLYREDLDVHAFAWAQDGSAVYLSVEEPQSKEQEDAHKAEWKDVIRWREQERGDVLLMIPLQGAIKASRERSLAHAKSDDKNDKPVRLPETATVIAHSPLEIAELAVAHSGQEIAFETGPQSHRLERPEDSEIYLVPATGGKAKQLTHNQGLESDLKWNPDGSRLYFGIHPDAGSAGPKYIDVQGRIYALDPKSGAIERLGGDFNGSWEEFAVLPNGSIVGAGLLGTEVQLYRVQGATATKIEGIAGSYAKLSATAHGEQFAFRHSGVIEPSEIYVAAGAEEPGKAMAITSFNKLFKDRAQVEWRTYQWTSVDGQKIEGVLVYPPGKMGAKHLRMLTLIHGGPADADGNHFGADWYDWATLAATNGWLVFRPNYRGSSGFGDTFMQEISPNIVSAPGRDILAGVDALVKDGTADPDRLAVGGYSYGGYMTNWLITQTTRFKAAVTGAGAVEHAANWGNDDLSFDDAWYLGGTPWERPDTYRDEAAIFRFNRVTTPTHVVAGDADVRVSYLEGVLLERALQRLNIPHSFLVFPGEGHPLDKNPWHGYVKVREELKWLEKYCGN